MSQGGANSNTGSGANPIETLTGNSGGAVSPDGAMNVDVLGNNSTGIDIVGTPASNLLTVIGLAASTTQVGTIEIATDAETIAYTSPSLAVSPSNLTAAFASPQPIGSTTPNMGDFTNLFASNYLYVNTAAPGNPYNISIEDSVAGLIGESIQNTSANVAAGVNLQLIVEPAAADTFTLYSVNGAATYSTGIDNSASDAFKITTGASPSAGTTAVSITTAGIVTLPAGPLDVPSGGTGLATITDHAVLIGSGTGAITPVGPVASTGALLASNGVGSDPGFTTATYPLTTTVSEILYSSSTNTVSGLTTGNNGVLITSATGVPSWLAAGTTGQILTATTGSPASWAPPAATGDVSGPGSSTDRAIATWNGTGGTDLFNNSTITISSAGEMVNTAQPAFLAYLGTSDLNVTGAGTTYTLGSGNALTEVFDQGGDFVTTGTFTAPVTGKYFLDSAFFLSDLTALMTVCSADITTSNLVFQTTYLNSSAGGGGTLLQIGGSVLCDMDAADTATTTMTVQNGAGNTADVISNVEGSRFSGNLVC